MRMLWKLPAWWAGTKVMTTDSVCKFQDINFALMESLGNKTSKRDLAFRFFQNSALDANIWVAMFRTPEDAIAATCAIPPAPTADRMVSYAYWFPTDPFPLSFSIGTTPTGVIPPDIIGLALTVSGIGKVGRWDMIYWYTGEIARVVCLSSENILKEYVGTGKALSAFTTSKIESFTPDSGARDRLIIAYPDPAGGDEIGFGDDGMFSKRVNFVIQVAETGGGVEACRLSCRRHADAVASIIGDERRGLDGLCLDTDVRKVRGPVAVQGDGAETYQVCELECVAEVVGQMYPDR